MNNKILVTGATGFFGYRIQKYLKEKDYQVLTPTRQEMNLLDRENIVDYIKREHPDYLIHCAAISDVVECEKDEASSHALNVEAVESVAMACHSVGTKLIFCSSEQIYFEKKKEENGNKKDRVIPHKEEEEVIPGNLYGRQKLTAEKICIKICPDAVCLRLTWMYDVKQELENEHGNFYTNTKAALAQEQRCRFPIYDYRGITNVWKVIENLPRVFELPGGIYNFGAENSGSTYDMMRHLFEKCGGNLEQLIENKDSFKDAPRNISMDTSKIKSYGIEFEDTLQGLIRYW